MSHIPSDTPGDMLVIVAKYPEPGTVKTRLGAVIGASRAAALYSAFLRDLAARFDTPHAPWTLCWACAPGARPPEALREIVGSQARIFPQRGDDFAERLYHICEDARARGARRLAIISSDAPQLGMELVAQAFAAVGGPHPAFGHLPLIEEGTGEDSIVGASVSHPNETRSPNASPSPTRRWGRGVRSLHTIAISPAEDGGYSLIALRLPEPPDTPPDLFRGITMSTPAVLAETLARAAALDLVVALLGSTFDVDEAADLGRLWAALRAAPALAPRSYAALARLIAAPLQRAQGPSGNEEIHGDIASRW